MASMRAFLFWLLALQLSFPAVADVDAEARQWLDRMSKVDSDLAYRGLLIYEFGDQVESLRITHGSISGRPFDYLEHLDGDRRTVMRSGSSLICVHPGQRLTRPLRDGQSQSVEAIENFYSLRLNGESRIAARSVVLIEAIPRDSFRLGYRFAFDRDSGLLLRYEQVDAVGSVLERFQFAEIEVRDRLSPDWQVVEAVEAVPKGEGLKGGAVGAAAVSEPEVSSPPAWLPSWLPPGFVSASAGESEGVQPQTYTDGLAMVSVFVEPVDRAIDSTGGQARRGATVAHTVLLSRGEQNYVVTVIGEVPAGTAQRIADGITWQGGAP